jgi:hypothetical protein
MIDPRINLSNRDLMTRQALQKLRVGTADSIRVRESFRQPSTEEFQEPPVFASLSLLVQKANQDSTFSTWAWRTVHLLPSRPQCTSIKPRSHRDDGGSLVIAQDSVDSGIQLGIR